MAALLGGAAALLASAAPASASASPTLVTTPSPTAVTLGATAPTLKDSAVLSGGSSPTGTITFTLFVNGGSTPVDTETVTVDGNGTYTTPAGFTLPATGAVTGTYQWDAAYSGDANNNAASDTGNPNEQVVVAKAGPTLTTTPSPAAVTLGAMAPTLKDVAVLAAGSSPTGTITFTLFVNGGSTPVDTETVTVDGNGTYTTPAGFTLPATGAVTGTYQWDAAYSGDADNNAASDTGNPNERVVVAKASPAITTKPGGTVVTGSALSDSAKLTSGISPTGTITFSLYDSHGHVVYIDHVTVSGDGSYTTAAGDHPGGFIPAVAGTYQWVVAYSGDSSNQAVSTRKGDEPETAVYGFRGFVSPSPKSTLKLGSTIYVKFRLSDTAGRPIAPAIAAKLAAARDVTATLTGRGIRRRSVSCTWKRAHRFFQCTIKTPTRVRTGRANPYRITAYENVGAGPVRCPAVRSATTPNPETVFFKKKRR
jgi:hypothetical protein